MIYFTKLNQNEDVETQEPFAQLLWAFSVLSGISCNI